MASLIKTRSETVVWLIGKTIDKIKTHKLPSNGDILRRIFFLIKEKLTVKEACNVVYSEISEIWDKAKIPMRDKQHVIRKMQKKYDHFRTLQKTKSRQNQTQINKESFFQESLNDLFDVAHANALELMKNETDRLFLKAQREKGRRGYIGSVDNKSRMKEEKKRKRKEEEDRRIKRERHRNEESLVVNVQLESSSTGEESSTADNESDEAMPGPSNIQTRKKDSMKEKITSPDLLSTLDRTKVSDRNAMRIISATASAMGKDIDEVCISRSTLQRERKKFRIEIANSIKKSFTTDVPLTVHWDAKLMPDLIGIENVDRLPVLVSGGGKSKLLGIPKLTSGTGQQMAAAVVECIEDWNITEHVKAMCFDTTASNTGNKKGACVAIETMLDRTLLGFACRHHINEIIVAEVFEKCFGCSSGPEIQLFKRFRNAWKTIDTSSYETDHENHSWKGTVLSFCQEQLNCRHPRADYKELLQLSVIFLGGDIPNFDFKQPGAMHRARWMAKIIYSIKIVLFKQQFKMKKTELHAIERFTQFAVQYYVPNWFKSTMASAAPRNDLEYMQSLQASKDKELSVVASRALGRHLWYLSEELVSLAFMDEGVPIDMKRMMVSELQRPGSETPQKKYTLKEKENISDKTLADFVTESSKRFFTKLSFEHSFLEVDPSEWHERNDYKLVKEYTDAINVTNDNAERGVALIESYNNHLTKNEDQLQYLLQVVEAHRDIFPDTTKATLKKGFK